MNIEGKRFCEICGKKIKRNKKSTCSNACTTKKRINNSEERICKICGKHFFEQKYKKKFLCSPECSLMWRNLPENKQKRIQKERKTNLERYGVENRFQLKEVQDEIKKINLEKYGEEYPMKLQQFKEKRVKTNIGKYGVKSFSQTSEYIKKIKKTNLERYGVEYTAQVEKFKEKGRKTCIEKYGVPNPLMNHEIFRKQQKSRAEVKKYKSTDLYYQGTYELYFLEEMEKKGKLNEVQNGKSYDYVFDEEEHVYHSDFFYNGENIEIKSGWTYNNNGKNKKLEDINKAKWKSVTDFGDKIRVLLSKQQIELFVSGIV
jgi:hypothetical protein